MAILKPDYNTNTNIVLWQGARGLDGDPGPQGVAGATVSLSNSTDAFISAANMVCLSSMWFNALFQGDRGQRGVMGEVGPKGGKVRKHINNTVMYMLCVHSFYQMDWVCCFFVIQGVQGPRGITGVPGPKGEAVSV